MAERADEPSERGPVPHDRQPDHDLQRGHHAQWTAQRAPERVGAEVRRAQVQLEQLALGEARVAEPLPDTDLRENRKTKAVCSFSGARELTHHRRS